MLNTSLKKNNKMNNNIHLVTHKNIAHMYVS